MVQRVLVTPFGMVSSALSASLFSHARGLVAKDSVAYAQRFLAFAVVLSPLVTVGALIASESFSFVFGAQWEAGRAVAAWVTLYLAQKFIFDSTFSVLAMQQRQKAGMHMQAGVFFVRIAVLVAVGVCFGFSAALVAFSIASSLTYYCAAQLCFQSGNPGRLRQFVLGAMDWIFPYLVVHAWLTSGAFGVVSLSYAVWAGVRLWSFGASLHKVRSVAIVEPLK